MRSEEYEQAAYALSTGEISDVDRRQTGKYYILRCVNDYDEGLGDEDPEGRDDLGEEERGVLRDILRVCGEGPSREG